MVVAVLVATAARSAVAANFNAGTISATIDTTNNFNAFTTEPYLTPETATDTNGTSTTTPDFVGSSFSASFSQTLGEPATCSGSVEVSFFGTAGDAYSLSGSTTAVGGTATLSESLYDFTTDSFLYDLDPPSATTGSPTGNLRAGDIYLFGVEDALSLTGPFATNTGSAGIIVGTPPLPEPSAAQAILIVAGACVPRIGRRRNRGKR